MERKITRERTRELQRQKLERGELQREGKTVMSHKMQTKKKDEARKRNEMD